MVADNGVLWQFLCHEENLTAVFMLSRWLGMVNSTKVQNKLYCLTNTKGISFKVVVSDWSHEYH